MRPELESLLALSESARLREEDPFTATWTQIAPTRILGRRSRFEVDLNRPREKAVYLVPADAWGLQVWKQPLSARVLERSLILYDGFYDDVSNLLDRLVSEHGKLVIYDLHTYNHHRQGPDAPWDDPAENPQVNLGTGTMNRYRWTAVVDRFLHDLRDYDFPGGRLDVRENVRFFGGHFGRWIHEAYPDSVCVLSIEVKKFFMDEWTGLVDQELLAAVPAALSATVAGVEEELEQL